MVSELAEHGVFQEVFKLFGIGGNAREVQAAIEPSYGPERELQTSIEDLTDTIGKQGDKIGGSLPGCVQDAEKKRMQTICRFCKGTGTPAEVTTAGTTTGAVFNQAQIDKLSGQIGRQWTGTWEPEPEEMKALPTTWICGRKSRIPVRAGYGGRLTETG